jgi:hypothetical protein
LEAQKKDVASSELTIGEKNVVPWELRVDESNNPCGSELIMVVVYNSNDEILPNTDWEFRSRNGGSDCFRIYIH